MPGSFGTETTKRRTKSRKMNDIPLPGGSAVDGDTALLLALAWLLYRQGADMTLILALLSVVLF